MMKERNYGIDLLRLVLMYMVCILHVLGQGGLLSSLERGTVKFNAFWFLEILCYCAVDSFAIISGYTASEHNRKFDKLANMWFQAFFYSFVLTGCFVLTGIKTEWGWRGALASALPVTSGKFWYFTAFFALFFAMPVLNKFFFSIDRNTAKKSFFILVFLFSGMEIIGGEFCTQNGYSAIWIIVLYSIGLLAKRIELFQCKKTGTLLAYGAISTVLTWAAFAIGGTRRFINYVSPTILLNGLILVVLFSRIRCKGNILSKITPYAFGIYLFQTNEVIWYTYIKSAFVFVGSKSLTTGILYVLAGGFVIFACGFLVEYLRSILAKMLAVPQLSRALVTGIDRVMHKLFVVLK